MLRLLCLMIPLALAGCEVVKNTGRVCLIPQNVECTCGGTDESGGSDGSDWSEVCGLPDEYSPEYEWISCRGTYPADVSYEIDARLYRGGGGYAVKEKCKAEVEGDRVRVSASFRHQPERDAIVEPPAYTTCTVGVLAAGTWTLEYGGNQATVEIGDPDRLQDMVCVESTEQHGR